MDLKNLSASPFIQFKQWFNEAKENSQIIEANACYLATTTSTGIPSARTILMKSFNEKGLIFFTNYQSRKSQEMFDNPNVALLFYWPAVYRQIRIEGRVEKISAKESNQYFKTRPRGSQIGAHISPQSQVIESRQFIEHNFLEFEEKFHGKPIPRPEHWGGFIIIPHYFEFWEGKLNRLHDRFRYLLKDGCWAIERLAP